MVRLEHSYARIDRIGGALDFICRSFPLLVAWVLLVVVALELLYT
jgi:hypothetical protein